MAAALVNGLQAHPGCGATIKYFTLASYTCSLPASEGLFWAITPITGEVTLVDDDRVEEVDARAESALRDGARYLPTLRRARAEGSERVCRFAQIAIERIGVEAGSGSACPQ